MAVTKVPVNALWDVPGSSGWQCWAHFCNNCLLGYTILDYLINDVPTHRQAMQKWEYRILVNTLLEGRPMWVENWIACSSLRQFTKTSRVQHGSSAFLTLSLLIGSSLRSRTCWSRVTMSPNFFSCSSRLQALILETPCGIGPNSEGFFETRTKLECIILTRRLCILQLNKIQKVYHTPPFLTTPMY